MSLKYNTSNKNIIMNYIINEKGAFDAKTLYNKIKSDNLNIGLTTIYRYLLELYNNGRLKKTCNDKNIAMYQYLEECDNVNHFYLKCEKCGKVIHIDCKCIADLSDHLSKTHNFKINRKDIFILGKCKECEVL